MFFLPSLCRRQTKRRHRHNAVDSVARTVCAAGQEVLVLAAAVLSNPHDEKKEAVGFLFLVSSKKRACTQANLQHLPLFHPAKRWIEALGPQRRRRTVLPERGMGTRSTCITSSRVAGGVGKAHASVAAWIASVGYLVFFLQIPVSMRRATNLSAILTIAPLSSRPPARPFPCASSATQPRRRRPHRPPQTPARGSFCKIRRDGCTGEKRGKTDQKSGVVFSGDGKINEFVPVFVASFARASQRFKLVGPEKLAPWERERCTSRVESLASRRDHP